MGSNGTTIPNTNTSSAAKHRWKILARALVGDRSSDPDDRIYSVRRFQCFGLFQSHIVEDRRSSDADWFTYTSQEFEKLNLLVRQLRAESTVKIDSLLGFNNTGNICIWPSEEVMTYHCLKDVNWFRNKSVIELGGGMTCLAGIAVAACTEASCVVLTDGNGDSVKNLDLMINENKESFSTTAVSSRLLRWGPGEVATDLEARFDCVLCADCFFFDEGRNDLVDLVHSLLWPGGQAVMFAPHRGPTLQAFVHLASDKFDVKVTDHYDDKIWRLHQQMKVKGPEEYDENLHYPVSVLLKKTGSS
ncbi:calmodulin-lysine N-methyltransferase-like [Haliotis rufescens]|uniref:calmodulin-lysine N-methyltransferase-like n=1 Tax=Haliotis rufescens TaxID=6454 RepID=UPI00201E826B|nr:calmodulin-lysine N-methyltransferase-like [Haliotis rufescens]